MNPKLILYFMASGTITALRAQANDPQRVNVFIDGSFALGVSLNTISTEKLFVGKVLSDQDRARLEQTEGGDKAIQAALRLLEARPRSSSEIRDRLRRKEFAPEQIDRAIERLEQLGMIDDAAFAQSWVDNRQQLKPRGIGALRDELRRKGIDRTIVDDVLSNPELSEGEDERAMAVARAAAHKYRAGDRAIFSRKLGSYLQRRGFGFDVIRPVIDTLWDEQQQAGDDPPGE